MRPKNVRLRLIAGMLATGLLISSAGSALPASAAGGPNLSSGKVASASTTNSPYVASNLNDGNQASYWESSGAFPQWGQIDLGTVTAIDQVVLKLPLGWGTRSQTLSLQGSNDGVSYSTIVGSAGYTFNPASNNAVTINFTAFSTRYVRANITANTVWPAAQLSELEVYGVSGTSPNLAQGKIMSSSSSVNGYVAGNGNDANQGTYWESNNNAFPQWLQVDLGATVNINKVVLKLPTGWGTRTQTLAVQGSTTGSNFSDIVASAGQIFNQAAANTVTLSFNTTATRYVRVNVTANTGWPAGQLSEFEVYGPSIVDPTPPSAPTNLAYTTPASGQIRLTWNASTDNVGVTGYDIYANGVLRTSVGNVLTYTDNQPDNVTVSYFVRAKDAAGNQSANSNTVTRAGSDVTPPSAPTNLAYTTPASGQIQLTWNASTDNIGVTGYDIYANGSLRASVGNVLTYTDSQPDGTTVAYFVRAKDAAGNQSANSNTVTRAGSDVSAPTAPTNLAYTTPASGQIRLTWNASTDNVGVTGYDIYANGSLRASVGNVLTYTDNQPDGTTVSYYVRAKDAAGNVSGNSNTVTRPGGGDSNLALSKPVTENGHIFTFAPENAVDGNVTTYWEGNVSPNQLTVLLGSNAALNRVVVKLNPDAAWGARQQTIQVFGREQASSSFTSIAGAQLYSFNPATGNSVTIPVTGNYADVRLQITTNTGAPGGQVAEFEVWGVPAPNPDLIVTATSASPAAPVESDAVTLTATVRNNGNLGSGATNVNFYLGTTKVGAATVSALAAGAQNNFSVNVGTLTAGTYALTAKVDEGNTVIEQNEGNNSYTSPTALVVTPVQSADLVAVTSWSPSNPSAGNTVTFNVAIRNQGNVNSSGTAHGITLTVLNEAGTVIRTLTGSVSGVISAGQTSGQVNLGTWTAANGKYTVRVVIANDSAELPVKQANNTSNTPLFVGRGANLPYDMYEAEDGTSGSGATAVGPNRTIGDLGGEASGRKAVTLGGTSSFVQWTTKSNANAIVVRFSIPDGTTSNLSIYVNGAFHKNIPLDSRYAWLYGSESGPSNSPGAGPRHLYDEANILLNSTVAAGSVIKLQRDSGQAVTTVDFINLELATLLPNPDAAHYRVPTGFTHQAVQDALDAVRMDTTGTWTGVYLPAGDYDTASKFSVYGKAINVVGAGVWHTRFRTPVTQENTDAGFRLEASASGSTFKHLAFFGNYVIRQDGPGKVWGEFKDIDNLTFDDVWIEHTVCGWWGVSINNWNITNSRVRDTFADGFNATSDSTNIHINNVEGRGNGDDAFALFSAIDGGGSVGNHGNIFENLSATLTWRAAGLAVYGGYDNIFRNMYIADMLTYSGITISSLDFGYPFVGFGSSPPTQFSNISLVRAGGHFWGAQTFGAIWIFAASKEFRGIRVNDVDIIDPTYSGIMFQSKYPEMRAVTDTIFTNISISGAQRSGDAFDAKSGFGIWVNALPEIGQGPAIGGAIFHNLTFSNCFQNIKNDTTTFTLTID